jgi:hypothetical protein
MEKTDLVTRVQEDFDNDVANHVYVTHDIQRVRRRKYLLEAAQVDRLKVRRKATQAAKWQEMVEAEREFKDKSGQ